MAEKYTHWRNLTNLDYLRAECFQPGEKKVLTIKNVTKEQLTDSKGAVEEKPVAYFEEDVLPMVLNVTNCKTIEKIYGTGNIYEWIGKKIQLFATKTTVAKETVPCIRIEKIVPQSDNPEYHCCVCGKLISEKMYNQSIEKYGKPYCSKECLDEDTQGKQLL